MLGGVVAILMSLKAVDAPGSVAAPLAESDSAGPTFGPPAPAAAAPKAKAEPGPACKNALPTEPGEIVVCAERPQGYRIDPDILQAGRDKRNRRQVKPPDRMVDTSCQVVGPMGCMNGPAINLVQAAVGAATMLKKAINGENVGKMFVTRPEPSEYELYLEAKRRREEAEADAPRPAAASRTPAAE